MTRKLFLLFSFIFCGSFLHATTYYYTNQAYVSFNSDAPQEIINASSNALKGLIDTEKKTFTFKVQVRTFTGFNSALQQEHFNEKFLEAERFPDASFNGKIIEDIDFEKDGIYTIRAKGKLSIHGVDQERIIKTNIVIKGEEIEFDSRFTVLLADFNIKIPKVVHEKIATEISVEVKGILKKKTLE